MTHAKAAIRARFATLEDMAAAPEPAPAAVPAGAAPPPATRP